MTWIKGGEPKVDTTVLLCGHPVLSFRDNSGHAVYIDANEHELGIEMLEGDGCGISLTRDQLKELLPTLQAYAHRETCSCCDDDLLPSNGPHTIFEGVMWCKPCQDRERPF